MTDEKAYREKLFKQLDNLKEIQQHHVPELLKQLKSYEAARQELTAAEERVKEAWDRVAVAVGPETNWGKALKDINQKNDDIIAIEREWEGILESSFVQMINKGLSQETKTTAKKEKDVRKAIIRFEQTTKNSSKSTLKRKKKPDGKDALDEHNQLMQDVEKKRELIASDVAYQCEMTYFMILQSIGKALKQKMECYDRIAGKAKDMNNFLGECIKIQPDFANAPKASVMDAVYKEKKSNSKKEKRHTISAGSAPGAEDDSGNKKGPTMFSRLAEAKGPAPPPVGGATKHASLYFDAPIRPDPVSSLLASPHNEIATGHQKAKAKWPFSPQREGDLPMKAGDILNILNSVGPWWMAELNGVTGRIPANYVELIPSEAPKLRPAPLGVPPSHGTMHISPRNRSPRTPGGDTLPNDLPPPPRLQSIENVQLDPVLPDIPPPPMSPANHSQPTPYALPDTLPAPLLDNLPAPELDPTVPPRDNDPAENSHAHHNTTPTPQEPAVAPPPRETPAPQVEWQQFTTEQGHVYYFNPYTGESKWTLD